MQFWQKIFGQYSSSTVVIHDKDDPGQIVDFIDFRRYRQKNGHSVDTWRKREKVGDTYVKRYRKAVRRFRQMGKKALRYGPIEERIYQVYKRSPDSLKRLLKGRINLRYQRGLRDDLVGAARQAQLYFPQMERIFISYGIPPSLTRLVFVESMFNKRAISKVGASGIWQFMPATAKKYLHINRLVDERNSVIRSTHGAAQLLRDNHRHLKTWPLAITAYNHGPSGVARAVRKLGTRDIATITNQYRAKGFGFASRNFYSEFIGANRAYHQVLHSPSRPPAPTKTFATLAVKEGLSINQIIARTSLSEKALKKHNPWIKPAAFTKLRNRPLPAPFTIELPVKLEARSRLATGRRNAKGELR